MLPLRKAPWTSLKQSGRAENHNTYVIKSSPVEEFLACFARFLLFFVKKISYINSKLGE